MNRKIMEVVNSEDNSLRVSQVTMEVTQVTMRVTQVTKINEGIKNEIK